MRKVTKKGRQALKSGQIEYFSGRACCYGHRGNRYAKTGKCVICFANEKYYRDLAAKLKETK